MYVFGVSFFGDMFGILCYVMLICPFDPRYDITKRDSFACARHQRHLSGSHEERKT